MKGRLLHPHAAIAFVALGLGVAVAQFDAADPVPKSQRQRDKELPQISVVDKLLAVEGALAAALGRSSEEQWARSYQGLFQKFSCDGALSAVPGKGADPVVNALALGIKASDAVLALKARNVEAMNLAAEQIDALARKLGATEAELGMANTVKKYARERRWLDAFMALGFLQRSILSYLRTQDKDRMDQAKLVIVGGWLQGGRCVTHVIGENYGDLVSNILREPRLVAMLQEALEDMDGKYKGDERVKKIIAALPEIKRRVNVGFHDPVKKEDVEWLRRTFHELVMEITTGRAAPKDLASPATSAAVAGTTGQAPVQKKEETPRLADRSDMGLASSPGGGHAVAPPGYAGNHDDAAAGPQAPVSGPLPDMGFETEGAPAAPDGTNQRRGIPWAWVGGLSLVLGIWLGRILKRRSSR